MTQSELKSTVLHQWAQFYGCDAADFSHPGIQIFHHKLIDKSEFVDVMQIEQRAYVEVGERHLERVQAALDEANPSAPLNAHQVAALCGVDQPEKYYKMAITFAESAKLITPTIPDVYTIRQLTQEDAPALKVMQDACTEQEVNEGEVAVDHEVAFGCFVEDRMVACASMYFWRGFADIGVLTHPEHRGRGLGRGVTAATARWILEHGHIPVYRYDLNNHGSAGISRSVGFEVFHHHESIKIG